MIDYQDVHERSGVFMVGEHERFALCPIEVGAWCAGAETKIQKSPSR